MKYVDVLFLDIVFGCISILRFAVLLFRLYFTIVYIDLTICFELTILLYRVIYPCFVHDFNCVHYCYVFFA